MRGENQVKREEQDHVLITGSMLSLYGTHRFVLYPDGEY